ncbi:MAG: hypothetical protein JSS86_20240, partial [Cyanobacteria bacterium SZAS LIN-2]|nr:hypothetical protein [Cyanobacteria bacterium SZAS LIN-2]
RPIGIGNNRPIDFQIWYNGSRKLRLNNIQAVVYAPNATIELPFNSSFAGAVVANRIVADGNNHISFDTTLLDTEFSE